MDKYSLAIENFKSGLNCAQAVAIAFAKEMDLSEEEIKKISIGFGGGFARQRLICGAVSAMAMVISKVKSNGNDKMEIYRLIQSACADVKAELGSIICGELLGEVEKPITHVPEERTKEYYKKRPCAEICGIVARITEQYIK